VCCPRDDRVTLTRCLLTACTSRMFSSTCDDELVLLACDNELFLLTCDDELFLSTCDDELQMIVGCGCGCSCCCDLSCDSDSCCSGSRDIRRSLSSRLSPDSFSLGGSAFLMPTFMLSSGSTSVSCCWLVTVGLYVFEIVQGAASLGGGWIFVGHGILSRRWAPACEPPILLLDRWSSILRYKALSLSKIKSYKC